MSALDAGIGNLDMGRPRGGEQAAFTIGGVLRRLTSIVMANGGVLMILAVVVWGIPVAFGVLFGTNAFAFPDGRTAVNLSRSGWLLFGFGAIVSLVVKIVAEGAIVHISMAGRGGWNLVAPVRTGARYFWPNIAIYIVKSIAIVFASMLLVVPGLMLTCRWLVAIQAAVAEGMGIGAALRRSRDLTKGHRWRIFGLVLMFFVIIGLLALGQFLLARALGGSNGAARVILIALAAAISIVTTVITYVGTTAIYLELREVREGGTTREIAAVFE